MNPSRKGHLGTGGGNSSKSLKVGFSLLRDSSGVPQCSVWSASPWRGASELTEHQLCLKILKQQQFGHVSHARISSSQATSGSSSWFREFVQCSRMRRQPIENQMKHHWQLDVAKLKVLHSQNNMKTESLGVASRQVMRVALGFLKDKRRKWKVFN